MQIHQEVLKKYNNRIHGTIEMTPIEARKPENQIQVFFNIRQKAQFKRKYPDLKMSDQVRTYIKPHTFKKGWDTSWSKEIYKIMIKLCKYQLMKILVQIYKKLIKIYKIKWGQIRM